VVACWDCQTAQAEQAAQGDLEREKALGGFRNRLKRLALKRRSKPISTLASFSETELSFVRWGSAVLAIYCDFDLVKPHTEVAQMLSKRLQGGLVLGLAQYCGLFFRHVRRGCDVHL